MMQKILKGDTSAAISIALADGFDYSNATVEVAYQGVVRKFTSCSSGQTLTFTLTASETSTMALGAYPLTVRIIGASGSIVTVTNAGVKIAVTDCVADVRSGSTIAVDVHGGLYGVDDLPDHYTVKDLREKINEIIAKLGGTVSTVLLVMACHGVLAAGVTAAKATLEDLDASTAAVVTNVTFEASGLATTQDVQAAEASAKAYTDQSIQAAGSVSPQIVTNISAAVTSNVVTRPFVEGLGIGGGVNTNAVRDLIAPATNAVFAAATNAVMTRVEEKRDMTNRVWSVVDRWNGEGITSLENTYGVLRKTEYFNNGNGWCIPLYFGDMEYWFAFIVKEYADGNLVYFDTEDEARNATSGWSIFTEGWIFHPATRTVSIDNLALSSELVSATNNAVRWSTIDGDKRIILNEGRDSEWNFIGFLRTEQNDGLYLHTGETIFFDNTFGEASTLTPDGTPLVTEDKMNAATNGLATANALAAVSNEVANWSDYWTGDRVRLSVTNYYGNTSGEPPRLRIEEAETNANGLIVGYRTVWDEVVRQTNYQHQITEQVADTSNAVMTAAYRQTYNQLANKAPRAWGTVTSAGAAAPANTVWVTEPRLVIAGGTEYAHVAVGTGAISVLAAHGQTPYTAGAEGQFRFCDESGENYFGFDVRSAYTIGCRTDGIEVNDQTHIVTLSYDLISAAPPTILHSTNLTTWAEAQVEWEQSPPTGQQVCYLNAGNAPSGFYKAQVNVAGGAKFLTNMQADLQGGIAATNEVAGVMQSVYPVITSTGVVWRVRQ